MRELALNKVFEDVLPLCRAQGTRLLRIGRTTFRVSKRRKWFPVKVPLRRGPRPPLCLCSFRSLFLAFVSEIARHVREARLVAWLSEDGQLRENRREIGKSADEALWN